MKVDRLIAITMFLLNRDIVSASVLAERFEVSKRTIQRDIEALNQAGIPIISTYGVEGGYEIMDGFKLIKQIANVNDYLNIMTALKGLGTAYEKDNIKTTLDKVASFMQGGQQCIFIDFSVARESIVVNDFLHVIEKSIYTKTLLMIEYTNADKMLSKRIIEPLALSFQWYAWYVFAYCTNKKDYRLFKLPRISSCNPVDGVFSKDHGNVEYLMRSKQEQDKRKYYNTRLLCKKEIKQQVLEYLGRNIVEEFDNGDFIISINLPFERMWFSLLMGFGNKVQVLDSDELKDMLREKAKEILSIY